MSVTGHETEITSSDISNDEKTGVDTTNPNAAEIEEPVPQLAVKKTQARISISVRALVFALVICVLVGAIGVLTWLYISAVGKLDVQARAARDDKRAEEMALDYAVNAAEMDYKDLNSWRVKLVKGTSPELKDKLTKAANDMEQILAPLQWSSTARPLAAKVRSDTGGIYIVDSFVSVLTKTMQAPDGLRSTATYSLTIDAGKGWQISDVGGIDAALGSK